MYVIESLRLRSKKVDAHLPSKREIFMRGVGVNLNYSSEPNFDNTIPEKRFNKVEQMDIGSKKFAEAYDAAVFSEAAAKVENVELPK